MFSARISAATQRLDSALRKTAIAAVVGTGLLLAASQSHAVVVYSGVLNLNVPATTNGLYLNVVTLANNLPGSTAGSTVPGWDLNLYGSAGLGFFNPASPVGGAYVVSSGTTVANLAPGTLISAANTYGSGGTTLISQWNLNSSNNYFGFRFVNEANSQVLYGWGRLSFGATITSPRTLVEFAYEDTVGGTITVGAVPEPATYGLMAVGVAGVLLARRRKQA
jgi:hypothetical protein